MPPLNIKVRDQRAFGRRPIVGNCVLKNLFEFKSEPPFAFQRPASEPGANPLHLTNKFINRLHFNDQITHHFVFIISSRISQIYVIQVLS